MSSAPPRCRGPVSRRRHRANGARPRRPRFPPIRRPRMRTRRASCRAPVPGLRRRRRCPTFPARRARRRHRCSPTSPRRIKSQRRIKSRRSIRSRPDISRLPPVSRLPGIRGRPHIGRPPRIRLAVIPATGRRVRRVRRLHARTSDGPRILAAPRTGAGTADPIRGIVPRTATTGTVPPTNTAADIRPRDTPASRAIHQTGARPAIHQTAARPAIRRTGARRVIRAAPVTRASAACRAIRAIPVTRANPEARASPTTGVIRAMTRGSTTMTPRGADPLADLGIATAKTGMHRPHRATIGTATIATPTTPTPTTDTARTTAARSGSRRSGAGPPDPRPACRPTTNHSRRRWERDQADPRRQRLPSRARRVAATPGPPSHRAPAGVPRASSPLPGSRRCAAGN